MDCVCPTNHLPFTLWVVRHTLPINRSTRKNQPLLLKVQVWFTRIPNFTCLVQFHPPVPFSLLPTPELNLYTNNWFLSLLDKREELENVWVSLVIGGKFLTRQTILIHTDLCPSVNYGSQRFTTTLFISFYNRDDRRKTWSVNTTPGTTLEVLCTSEVQWSITLVILYTFY